MKSSLIYFMFISLALAACNTTGSKPPRPDIPGKIVFAANDDNGTSQIYSMKANGTDIKQLTHEGQNSGPSGASQPSWSPDGRRIIYSSFARSNTTTDPAMVVMNADGSNKHLLYKYSISGGITLPLYGRNARWSPDGTKIAYDLCPNCELRPNNDIYVFDIATKTHRKLTQSTASDLYPTWSPDGQKIAFTSDRDYVNDDTLSFRRDLYSINVDGSNVQKLTQTGNVGQPNWSPAGNKIVYVFNIKGNEVFLYSTNSGKLDKLESGFNFAKRPSWSKYDTRILIIGTETKSSQFEIKLLNVENDSTTILQKIMLNKNINGINYDWYNK